jgi:polyhydroxyalkanoate synthesis regulator phasin
MLTNISDDLKKIFLFGIGAVAITAEKSKILIDELVEKGEITLEQGKILNEELKHNIKETFKDSVTVNVVKPETPPTAEAVVEELDKMSPEDLQKIREKLDALSSAQDEKNAETVETAKDSNDQSTDELK